MQARLPSFLMSENGSAATEFALTIPLLTLLIFGVIHLGFLMYATTQLRWTAEAAARCGVISMSYATAPGDPFMSCQSKSTTKTFALNHYAGPNIGLTAASFTPSVDAADGCRKVTASGTYKIFAGFANADVPLSASACFPADTSVSWP